MTATGGRSATRPKTRSTCCARSPASPRQPRGAAATRPAGRDRLAGLPRRRPPSPRARPGLTARRVSHLCLAMRDKAARWPLRPSPHSVSTAPPRRNRPRPGPRPLRASIDEVLPGHVSASGGAGQIDDRLRPALRRREEKPRQVPARAKDRVDVTRQPRADHARVEAVRDHAGRLEAPRQLAGEEHVRELRVRVGAPRRPGALQLEVVEVDQPARVRRRAGGHDPRRRRLLQALAQQVGEQERGEVVDLEGQLVPVGRSARGARRPHRRC